MSFDIYLQRSSHISQILLVFIATFGYFYTVVPVFEKEKLNEDLIQAQNKLTEINKKYSETYTKFRNMRVNGMYGGALMKCTGLLIKPKPLPLLGQPIVKEKIITINSSACFKDYMSGFLKSNSLNKEDNETLKESIKSLALEILNIYNPNKPKTYEQREVFYEKVREIIHDRKIKWKNQ